MKKLFALTVALMMSVCFLTACGLSDSSNDGDSKTNGRLKVAGIFSGAIDDGSWNETQYNGLMRIGETGAETAYMEKIADKDVEEACRVYIDQGYDLIFLSTNSFQDYCTNVAKEFPDTVFVQINGTIIADNFISVRIADEDQGFMQGAIAALLSKTGKVGFVGGREIDPVLFGSAGFAQGVNYVNETYGKNVETIRRNTASMSDYSLAKEITISMIDQGCDVVAPMANDASAGVMDGAREKNAMAIATGTDLIVFAQNQTQVVVEKDISMVYDGVFKAFEAGTFKPAKVETYGASKGIVFLTDWKEGIDSDVKAKAEEIYNKLVSGEIKIKTDGVV